MEGNKAWEDSNKKGRRGKQWLAAWLVFALLAQLLTGLSYGAPMDGGTDAGYETGICVHHTEHTKECGYQKAQRCSHDHVQECYEKPDEEDETVWVQSEGQREATPSDATLSDATPSDATPSDAKPENCTHIHDDFCGYAEAHACEYHCKLCAGEELSLEEQAKAMEEQIETQRKAQRDARSEAAVQASARSGRSAFHRSAGSRTFAPASLTPFKIGSEAVLRELAEKVNGGETWANGDIAYAECTYELTADINLSQDWTPAGTKEHPFTGTFDGGGFVIRNMVTAGQGPGDCGLFGYIKGGTVEDLGLVDVGIYGVETVGAVAGALYGGTIRRCYSTGFASSSVLSSDKGCASGGIVGRLYEGGSVRDCYSDVSLKGSSSGGIAGELWDSKMENCYSTGDILVVGFSEDTKCAGGLIGALKFSKSVGVTNSAALNSTLGPRQLTLAGRVMGVRIYTGEGSPDNNHVTVRNNYAFSGMKVNGSAVSGGTHDNDNGADFSYDSATETFSTPWEDIFSDTSAWDIEPGRLPILKGLGGQDGEIPEWLVNGTTADLYIGSAEELKAFRDRVNGADGEAADSFAGRTVRLTADITLDDSEDWTPIGSFSVYTYFSGTFDGSGHVIRGLTIRNNAENVWSARGLFGEIKGGTVRNLGVKDVNIYAEKTNTGAVAGVVTDGKISNCYSTGVVYTEHTEGYIGGIAGGIVNLTSVEDLPTIEHCYSTVTVQGGLVGGGIAGAITSSTIKNCYFAGNAVEDGSTNGGIVGGIFSVNNAVKNSAALNSVTNGQSRSARITDTSVVAPNMENNYAFSGMKVNGSTVTGGEQDNGNGADLTYDPDIGTFSTSWETIFGGDTSAWDIQPGRLPVLKGIGGQDGTVPEWIWQREAAPLLIGSEAELIAFRNMVNGTGGMTADNFEGKTVKLTADIRLTEEWTPIGYYTGNINSSSNRPFKGVFDGDGYIIRGLSIHDKGMMHAGLFSYVEGGTVKNLGLKEVEIEAKIIGGAVVGFLKKGIIRNCFSEGTVITENGNTGGIAGRVTMSEIKNCYSKGSVAGAGNGPVGGIVGMLGAGEVRLEHCYSAGSAAGSRESGGLVGSVADSPDNPPTSATVRCSAALLHTLAGGADVSGRIVGHIGTAPQTVASLEQNCAFSGMKVNGGPAAGDDGTGQNGMDGSLKELVMDRTIFPASDWVLKEGCYPVLKVFADRGEEPVPLEYWLVEQVGGRFGIEVETPASYTFPETEEGYLRQAAKTVAVVNTGKEATGELTVTFAEQKKDGEVKTAVEKDYFILTEAAGGAALENTIDSIASGGTGSFAVAPADGLKAGTYTARLRIAGNYGLAAAYEVSFTVNPDDTPTPTRPGSSDGDSYNGTREQSYTILTGDIPASVGSGVWERQLGGGWKFYKVASSSEGGTFAVREWLMVDGFWYLFDEEGRMVTGWASVNGVWYYLSTAAYAAADPASLLKEGAMVTGWLCDPATGRWFWMDANGAMATGWREIDGKRYYFNPESDGMKGNLVEDATVAS